MNTPKNRPLLFITVLRAETDIMAIIYENSLLLNPFPVRTAATSLLFLLKYLVTARPVKYIKKS
jgi:hypothetical protein